MEFKRMLSWQLSTPREEPPKKFRKKRKKLEFKGSDSDSSEEDVEYVVINSEGEEEKYFSAPESPASSDEDAAPNVIEVPLEEVSLPPQGPGRSNRSKRRRRYALRKAKAEFFHPLCDLMETKLFVGTGPPDVKNFNEVPTLVELCLRAVEQGPKEYQEDELPYLLRSLLSNDRQLQSVASGHLRWLEKLLGAYEVCGSIQGWVEDANRDTTDVSSFYDDHAYQLQKPWTVTSFTLTEFPPSDRGLHCLLPEPFSHTMQNTSIPKSALLRTLFHFANYFYPLLMKQDGPPAPAPSGEGTSPLTVAQLSAIRRVNKFLRLRYPRLTGVLSETMKLWPAYVYWARGHCNLATSVFTSALELLTEEEDKGVAMNELARMLVMFGDRTAAWRYFRRSSELAEGIFRELFSQNGPQYIEASTWALQCASLDTGWLDCSAARESARAWEQLLKKQPTKLSILYMAACEAKMMCHCGHPVATSAGTKEEEVLIWLRECETLLMSCTEVCPLLNFHLSQVRAMMGLADSSLRAYSKFVMDYAGFIAWDTGHMPGRLFSAGVPTHLSPHPWKPLLDLTTSQNLAVVPLLSLQWRTTFLHPRYPYANEQESKVADHCPEDIGLRLTVEGYLTADISMDLPPLSAVLLDPYTGSLCFSHKLSLQHYWLSQTADYYSLPHPLRLFESEHCAVELVMGHSVDAELTNLPTPNYLAALHWYGADGSHHKLDVRKLIRQHCKKAILDLIPHWSNLANKGREHYLDIMMEQGMKLDIKYLSLDKPPAKYKVAEVGTKKKKKKQKKKQTKKATRDSDVHDFYLFLTSHVVYGQCTLMLGFSLEDTTYDTGALMFVNCSSVESFLNPKVYCVGSGRGFIDLFPSSIMAAHYPNRHLKHVRYAVAKCTERRGKVEYSRIIVDEEGEIVRRDEDNQKAFPICLIAGTRQLTWITGDEGGNGSSAGMLMSSSLDLSSTQVQDAFPVIESVEVVPGIVFVATPQGVSLLHPESLQPLTLLGLSQKTVVNATSESSKWYQFWGTGLVFNILKTYDVLERSDSSSDDYGSGTTVFSLNDRLIVVRARPGLSTIDVMLDIQLPGEVTDFHPIAKKGYIITTSQYHDHSRQDLYWISDNGRLQGMLPCLGPGNKSFCSAVLKPMAPETSASAQTNPSDTGGMYVFFNDGKGGISCIKPQ